jgi:hypothetical protein
MAVGESMTTTDRQQRKHQPERHAMLEPVGIVSGAMDSILTSEEAVWVSLADKIKPEDLVGLEVFVRLPA